MKFQPNTFARVTDNEGNIIGEVPAMFLPGIGDCICIVEAGEAAGVQFYDLVHAMTGRKLMKGEDNLHDIAAKASMFWGMLDRVSQHIWKTSDDPSLLVVTTPPKAKVLF